MIAMIAIIGVYMYYTSDAIQVQDKKLDYMMDVVTCMSEKMQEPDATTLGHGGAVSETHPAEETDEFRLLNMAVAHKDEYGYGSGSEFDNVSDDDGDDDGEEDDDIDIDADDDDESLNDTNRVFFLPDSLVEISEGVIPDTETPAVDASVGADVKIEEDADVDREVKNEAETKVEVDAVTDYHKMSIVDLRKMYKSRNPGAVDVGKMKKNDIIAFFNTPVELHTDAVHDCVLPALDDEVY